MNPEVAIQIKNVSKVFSLRQPQKDENGNLVHDHWALKDVSVEIKKGESVGIIGPNGSGKSTLLQILAGIIKPTEGEVQIRGKVASILDIGAGFHPELSGRENVFLNGQIHGFSKKEIQQKYDEIVAFSGIEKFIDEPVKNYSNGMYLRLAFSIMAHLDFDVFLFDEVLSVGDAEFQNKCVEKIKELSNSHRTFVIVYHNQLYVEKIVNREINISSSLNKKPQSQLDGVLLFNSHEKIRLNLDKEILNKITNKIVVTVSSTSNIILATSEPFSVDDKSSPILISLNINLTKGIYVISMFNVTNFDYNLIASEIIKINTSKKKFSPLDQLYDSVSFHISDIQI